MKMRKEIWTEAYIVGKGGRMVRMKGERILKRVETKKQECCTENEEDPNWDERMVFTQGLRKAVEEKKWKEIGCN